VLEGATLGGQLIARHVIPLLGLAPDAGAAFFTSYGAEVGARWRSLGEFLRRQLGREADVQRAAGAACDTFGKLDCWLARGQEPYDGA
jgi:heme oxygenase